MEYILQSHELTKLYGKKAAADHVSMSIQKGDIYGFIGKNGAGKTTFMKMVLGMIFPSGGTLELFGRRADNAARKRIGSLIEAPGLYKSCTAKENLRRFAILYGGNDADIDRLLKLVQLENTGKKTVGEFSLGMKQRLGIALALLGSPEFLVLDEPVNGLDPAAIKNVRDIILNINREYGITVLISSHLLGELAKISTRYGIINQGILVEELTAQELMENCRHTLTVCCREPEIAVPVLREELGIESEIRRNGETITLFEGLDRAEEINAALVRAGAGVYDLHNAAVDMEDYFIERIGAK